MLGGSCSPQKGRIVVLKHLRVATLADYERRKLLEYVVDQVVEQYRPHDISIHSTLTILICQNGPSSYAPHGQSGVVKILKGFKDTSILRIPKIPAGHPAPCLEARPGPNFALVLVPSPQIPHLFVYSSLTLQFLPVLVHSPAIRSSCSLRGAGIYTLLRALSPSARHIVLDLNPDLVPCTSHCKSYLFHALSSICICDVSFRFFRRPQRSEMRPENREKAVGRMTKDLLTSTASQMMKRRGKTGPHARTVRALSEEDQHLPAAIRGP
jgi:hypothetical protein